MSTSSKRFLLMALLLTAWGTILKDTGSRPFDKPPFILLNLLLSFQAAFTAPIIMMSQNRQEARDRERSRHIERMTQHIEVLTENMAAVLQRIEMVEASILSSLNSFTIE